MGQHEAIDMWLCQLLENSELNSFDARVKFGIKSVLAEDYMPYNTKDPDDIDLEEQVRLVQSTNTMSTSDMADSYMYGWMIIHWHTQGYTNLISRYARNVLGISFKDFYNSLLQTIQSDPTFSEHYFFIRDWTHEYLKTGKMNSNKATLSLNSPVIKGHALAMASFEFVYSNKNLAIELGIENLKKFTKDIEDISILQKLFIFDKDAKMPVKHSAPWNLFTGEAINTVYEFNKKYEFTEDLDVYILRRKGLLKNQLSLSQKI
jgi:hypothetical protein